jgi:hypothetical protein
VLFDQECLVEELIRLHLSSDSKEMIDWDLNGKEDSGGVADRFPRGERDGALGDEVELETQMLSDGSRKSQKSGGYGEGKEDAHPHYC